MKKWLFIFLVSFLMQGCNSCPATCNDNNICTEEFCSEETGYKCFYEYIIPCCGNGKCEANETFESCQKDCKIQEEDCLKMVSPTKKNEPKFKFIYHQYSCKNIQLKFCLERKNFDQFPFVNSLFRGYCVMDLAIKYNDIKLCDNLVSNKLLIEDMYWYCVSKLKKDRNVCKKIGHESILYDDCLRETY